jgi:predicted dehydrogenase
MNSSQNSRSFKIAFIGAGFMATEHARAFRDIPEVQLAGIHSRTKQKAEGLAKKFQIIAVCDSISALYQATKADLVVISVPELMVGEVCQEAFRFPWICLVEKPAGLNVEDAQRICSEASKQGVTAYVALNRRHYSSTRNLLSALQEHTSPRLISIWDQQDMQAARRAGQPEAVVQNWMYANSIHVIDYFRILGRGAISNIETVVPWNAEKPDFVVARISYDSGDIGIYQAVWNGPGPWSVSVTTQEKRWELRPLENLSEQPYGSRKLDPIAGSEWDQSFKAGVRQQAEEAIRSLKGESHNLPSLEEGLNTMRLVQAIYGKGY